MVAPLDLRDTKVIFFDLMGTCLDWHSSIVDVLGTNNALNNPRIPSIPDVSQFALDWRQGFFDEIHARFERQEGTENIDITHRRILDRLLTERGADWSEYQRCMAVKAWHGMKRKCYTPQ